jgi:hypothetical protein
MMPIGWLETRRVSDAMRAAGAVSPATARRASDLPEVVRSHLERYVMVGVVREGAPGTFYLYEVTAAPWTPGRVMGAVLFWLLVIIIPVVILQLSN